MKNPQDVRFVYVPPYDTGASGMITAAYKFDDENKVIVYNSARCGRKDQFVKSTGRAIATGRLNSNRTKHPNRTIPYAVVSEDGENPRYALISSEVYLRICNEK